MCEMLKEKLDAQDAQYEICRDIDVMEKIGIRHVPILQTDEGKLLNLSDAIRFVEALTRHGC